MSTGGLQPKRRTPALPEGRYFIALRPSARVRQSLARLARSLAAQFGGNPLQAHDLHLTLARGAHSVTQEQVLALTTCFEPIPAQQMQLAIGTSCQVPAGRRYHWIKPVEPDRTDVIKL